MAVDILYTVPGKIDARQAPLNAEETISLSVLAGHLIRGNYISLLHSSHYRGPRLPDIFDVKSPQHVEK